MCYDSGRESTEWNDFVWMVDWQIICDTFRLELRIQKTKQAVEAVSWSQIINENGCVQSFLESCVYFNRKERGLTSNLLILKQL